MPPDAQDEAQSLPNGGRGEVEKKDALAAVALDGIPARMGDGVMGEYVDEGDVDGAAPGVVPNENESERTWCEVELDAGWPAPNEVDDVGEMGMGTVREGGEGGRPDIAARG